MNQRIQYISKIHYVTEDGVVVEDYRDRDYIIIKRQKRTHEQGFLRYITEFRTVRKRNGWQPELFSTKEYGS